MPRDVLFPAYQHEHDLWFAGESARLAMSAAIYF
jgi:hypothetical protein